MKVILLMLFFSSIVFSKEPIISNLINPESSLLNNNSLYVSQMGKDAFDLNIYDGKVKKYSLLGKEDSLFKITIPLISPMGMTLVNKYLFFTDMNRVVGVNKETGDLFTVFDLSSIGATFLNDIVSINDNSLLVTATNLQKVFELNLIQNSINEVNIDLLGSFPNGIAFDKKSNQLYLASNEKHALGEEGNGIVKKYDYKNKIFTLIESNSLGKFIDGISISKNNILVSDWYSYGEEGRIYYLSKDLDLLKTNILNTAGLADISYANGLLATPDLINGRVYIYKN